MSILKLKKEFDLDGKKVTEIEYDFDNLTGNALEETYKSMARKRYVPAGPFEMDPIVAAHIFAQSANIDYEDVARLPLKSFNEAVSLARDFFIEDLVESQAEDI